MATPRNNREILATLARHIHLDGDENHNNLRIDSDLHETGAEINQEGVTGYESSYSVTNGPVAERIRLSGSGSFSELESVTETLEIRLDTDWLAANTNVIQSVNQIERITGSGLLPSIQDTEGTRQVEKLTGAGYFGGTAGEAMQQIIYGYGTFNDTDSESVITWFNEDGHASVSYTVPHGTTDSEVWALLAAALNDTDTTDGITFSSTLGNATRLGDGSPAKYPFDRIRVTNALSTQNGTYTSRGTQGSLSAYGYFRFNSQGGWRWNNDFVVYKKDDTDRWLVGGSVNNNPSSVVYTVVDSEPPHSAGNFNPVNRHGLYAIDTEHLDPTATGRIVYPMSDDDNYPTIENIAVVGSVDAMFATHDAIGGENIGRITVDHRGGSGTFSPQLRTIREGYSSLNTGNLHLWLGGGASAYQINNFRGVNPYDVWRTLATLSIPGVTLTADTEGLTIVRANPVPEAPSFLVYINEQSYGSLPVFDYTGPINKQVVRSRNATINAILSGGDMLGDVFSVRGYADSDTGYYQYSSTDASQNRWVGTANDVVYTYASGFGDSGGAFIRVKSIDTDSEGYYWSAAVPPRKAEDTEWTSSATPDTGPGNIYKIVGNSSVDSDFIPGVKFPGFDLDRSVAPFFEYLSGATITTTGLAPVSKSTIKVVLNNPDSDSDTYVIPAGTTDSTLWDLMRDDPEFALGEATKASTSSYLQITRDTEGPFAVSRTEVTHDDNFVSINVGDGNPLSASTSIQTLGVNYDSGDELRYTLRAPHRDTNDVVIDFAPGTNAEQAANLIRPRLASLLGTTVSSPTKVNASGSDNAYYRIDATTEVDSDIADFSINVTNHAASTQVVPSNNPSGSNQTGVIVTDGFSGHPATVITIGNYTFVGTHGSRASELFAALQSASIDGWTVAAGNNDTEVFLTANVAGSRHNTLVNIPNHPDTEVNHGTGNGTFVLNPIETVIEGRDTEYSAPSNDFLAELMDRPIPTHAGDWGQPGNMAYADGYLYLCIAVNTWQRVQLSTW